MKIVVFGATGGTGKQVVLQALDAGHVVTAVARRPEALKVEHANLTKLQGDVLDGERVRRAVAGQEIVVSSIGVMNREPTRIYSTGLLNILLAMNEAKIRRLICVSASGLDPGPLLQKLIAKPLLWWLFKEGFTDMARMEVIVQASEIDWTIVRPPRLTDEGRTGRYEVAVQKHLTHGWKISRADLADYIVKHLVDPATNRATIEIAY